MKQKYKQIKIFNKNSIPLFNLLIINSLHCLAKIKLFNLINY